MFIYDPIPFWPSRRLWLKFFIGLIYVPLLFDLLIWVLIPAAFFGGLYLVLFFLLLIGAPISVGLLLVPSRRGIGAGLVALVAIPVIWYFASVVSDATRFIDETMQVGIIAASIVVLIELITRDVREQRELVGLGIGLVAGFLLILANDSLVGPFHYTGDDALMLFSLYVPNALVWLSALFFPEWVSRKVGWGGIIVWAGLVGLVLSASFVLMK